jgi:hypothetical protein
MEYLIELGLSGHDSFGVNYSWLKSVTGIGEGTLFCPHCHNIYEGIKSITAVIQPRIQHTDMFIPVVQKKERRTDMDLIAGGCGHVQLFSTHFIDVVGLELVERTAYLGQLLDAAGFEHARYRTVVCKDDSVVVRGLEGSSIKLGKQCWPIGARGGYATMKEKYVIRRELPREPFFLSDGRTFCTPEFYEKRIQPAKLCRVDAHKIPILDEPLDGLPARTDELKAYLKSHKTVK